MTPIPRMSAAPTLNGTDSSVMLPKAGTAAGWHLAKAAGLPQRIVNGIAIDPADPRSVYVALGAYSRRWLPPGAMGEDASKVGKGHVICPRCRGRVMPHGVVPVRHPLDPKTVREPQIGNSVTRGIMW